MRPLEDLMNLEQPMLPFAELEAGELNQLDACIQQYPASCETYPEIYELVNELITTAYRQGLKEGASHGQAKKDG